MKDISLSTFAKIWIVLFCLENGRKQGKLCKIFINNFFFWWAFWFVKKLVIIKVLFFRLKCFPPFSNLCASLSRVFVHPAVFYNRSSLAELNLEIAFFGFFYPLKERGGRFGNTFRYCTFAGRVVFLFVWCSCWNLYCRYSLM